MIRRLLLALALLAMTPCFAFAQEAPAAIERGGVYASTIAATESRVYTIDLEADTFVLGYADQKDVDVVVTVTGPAGEQVGAFDVTATGKDRLKFETTEAGAYRIEVTGFEDAAGSFELCLTHVEPLAESGPERIDQLMAMIPGDAPGAVIGVFQNGEVVFAKAYGMANLTYDVPFTTATRTNIGSTSKQFTAFAIALLAQRGELSLDDEVRAHIPELPAFEHPVTLRHLISHTSGYREFLNTLSMGGRQLGSGDHIDRAEIIRIVQRQPELQNVPGAEWNYNNTGYAMLAMTVERVTGTPFDEWMRENVFVPLGMNDTFVRSAPDVIIENSAMGYVGADGGSFTEARDLGGAMGAGGIYTTAADLGKWINNFHTQGLGGEGIFEVISTPFLLNDGAETGYAYGLMVDELGGLQRVQHGGADVAHRAMLHYYPEINAGVVALSNNANFPAGPAADDAARAFFGDQMTDNSEADSDSGAEDGEAFDAATYDAAWFEPLAGRYELEIMPGFIMSFEERGGAYYTQATGQPEIEITPTGRHTFEIKIAQASIEFNVDDEGVCDSLTLHQNGSHSANRVAEEPWAPSAAELDGYAGTYYCDELQVFYELRVDEDSLVVDHIRLGEPMAMTANKEDHFSVSDMGMQLEFERDGEGVITGFRASSGRTRDVRFVRQP